MKFATIGHLLDEKTINLMPKDWIREKYIISPKINLDKTSGHIIALKLTAKQIMQEPRDFIRKEILDAVIFAQDSLDINLIQLGALTTSVTEGGKWLAENNEYQGFLNHGDSYTAAAVCQITLKAIEKLNKNPSDQKIAIVGAYGIIGEAVSKILVPKFAHSLLIGRRKEKLKELGKKIEGNFETTTNLDKNNADIIITATNHPTALLESRHLKKNAIIIDVSQPPNLSPDICLKRSDIIRVDGGFVNFNHEFRQI